MQGEYFLGADTFLGMLIYWIFFVFEYGWYFLCVWRGGGEEGGGKRGVNTRCWGQAYVADKSTPSPHPRPWDSCIYR